MVIGTEKTAVPVSGVDTAVWRSMVTIQLESGRYLQPGDSNAVVIGYSLAHGVFLQPVTLNRPVTIGGKSFKIAFSVFVGVISGVMPARTAAKMNPVDALRFEQ